MKTPFTTYLFDFDGTLVDSMPTFVSVMLKILKENNISYDEDIVKVITPLGYKGTARYFKKIGHDMAEDDIVQLMNAYALEAYKNTIEAKKNVVETLKKLKENNAHLNILTASPHSMLDVCLKRLGIYELFTNVWSCDDFNTNKADPHIYEMAAEKIGKPIGEILFLDDNYNAVKTAGISGIKVCGVYDASSEGCMNDMKNVCDYYICDFSEILDLEI